MTRPRIAYLYAPVRQETCERIRELGYHVVVFEEGTMIDSKLIASIEEQVIAWEEGAKPTPFFIAGKGGVQ